MAYNAATITKTYLNSDGSILLTIVYTGNAGEVEITDQFTINLSTPLPPGLIRGNAMQKIALLNNNKAALEANVPPIVLDVTTPLPPANTAGSYILSTPPFTPGANPTDIITINGSATKLVVISKLTMTMVQTTTGINTIAAIVRSTQNTGGTFTTPNGTPLSAAFPAPTALIRQYSANPAGLGNPVGPIYSGRIVSPSVSSLSSQLETAIISPPAVLTLSGTTQGVSVSFNGVALPAGSQVQFNVFWSEQ